MKVAALTPGINVASSRFRVRQYIPALSESGICVDEFTAKINYSSKLPGVLAKVKQKYIFPIGAAWIGIKAVTRLSDVIRSNRFDAVWVNRVIANPFFIEKYITRPLVYDIDDAIWINNEKNIGKIASHSSVILAGNEYIASNLEKYNTNIKIVPTAIDTKKFTPIDSDSDDLFRIVWTGSRDTIHYLKSIEKPLATFLNENKDSRLTIISDIFPRFSTINQDKILFIPWSPSNEVTGIQHSNVGIMPLLNTEWDKGKCSYKMLQYMSCGLPVIVSPVGMNREVLAKGEIGISAAREEDWISALKYLHRHPDKGEKMGKNGVRVVEGNYSLPIVTNKLIEVFRNI
jgi:glycosyltransferase involved in cell wall biosynthesis